LRNKSALTREVHLDIKDDLAINVLVHRTRFISFGQQFKGNSNIVHLLLDGVSPEGVSILLVDEIGFRDCLGNSDRVRVTLTLTVLPSVNTSNDPISFLKSIGHPPSKGRLMCDSICYSILCQLNWSTILDVLQLCPRV
jgi:hypothetical protein